MSLIRRAPSHRPPPEEDQNEIFLDHSHVRSETGISTDLVGIEQFIDEVLFEIEHQKDEFFKLAFTPQQKNPLKALNAMRVAKPESCD